METSSPSPPPPPPPPPFSDCPRVFTKVEALVVPEKKDGSDRSFLTCAPTNSCTYVPTIPRVPSLYNRRVPAPAPLPPPHSSPPPLPPVVASADFIGPLNPVLTDGKHRFHVEGLIAAGGYGRVALATVEGSANPALQVAIKVYSKDNLIANRFLHETYDLERRIMLGNTKNECKWLVNLRGTFGDTWNRYLIMVRDHASSMRGASQTHLSRCCFAAQDYYPNSLTGIIFDPEFTPLPKKIVRHWVEELVRFSFSPHHYPTDVLTLYQQTMGMCELYARDIVHCDLKPGNILVSPEGHLAIADFGISLMPDDDSHAGKPLEECEFFSFGGTYAYQAPELLISRHGASFTCAVDMWSLGVIIFEMYTGRVRFACY